MNTQMVIPSSSALIPLPQLPIAVRPATLTDLPFMDALQKLHTKQVGWMPTATLEGKIRAGHVLVAEESRSADCADDADFRTKQMAPVLSAQSAKSAVSSPLGYCIATDQYFKHDDVGIIYQMNVVPGRQRGLIGASLLKAQFERSAYGCKLYCCWCAQDIAANHFWEAMGFVPLAFRTGGKVRMKKASNGPADSSFIPPPSSFSARVHIFWQKRIRSGDTITPWWFPSQTAGGSIREDRIVLPIPSGTHWSDAKPLILPALSGAEGPESGDQAKQLPAPRRAAATKRKTPEPKRPLARNGLMFDIPRRGEPLAAVKPKREPKQKRKNDPRMVAAARELRDRWLEEVNAGKYLPESAGKYEVSRAMETAAPKSVRLLNVAA